ncbi:MAG: RHS repeat-associated core domain-containing protein, partial [candidate division Zixibacteria bacterium]|nr:RHS repeat-associated core domain-containing protein [candidate division Zixibacteria bacterium]
GTGLYNYDARLYDPVIGQFIMADTIVPDLYNPQSLNRYAYCLNNPVKYKDPSGHIAVIPAILLAKFGGLAIGWVGTKIAQYSASIGASQSTKEYMNNTINAALMTTTAISAGSTVASIGSIGVAQNIGAAAPAISNFVQQSVYNVANTAMIAGIYTHQIASFTMSASFAQTPWAGDIPSLLGTAVNTIITEGADWVDGITDWYNNYFDDSDSAFNDNDSSYSSDDSSLNSDWDWGDDSDWSWGDGGDYEWSW